MPKNENTQNPYINLCDWNFSDANDINLCNLGVDDDQDNNLDNLEGKVQNPNTIDNPKENPDQKPKEGHGNLIGSSNKNITEYHKITIMMMKTKKTINKNKLSKI